MSLMHCQVEFANQQSVYQPGDVLSGRVILMLEERLLLKAFALQVSGYANVRWEKVKPVKKSKQAKDKKNKLKSNPYAEVYAGQQPIEQDVQVYSNREDFINTTNFFIGSEEAFAKIVERGTYTYPFTVNLPRQCPSSFESPFGHIRYQLEVFADFPDRRESCYMLQLPVRKPYDLRQHAATLEECDVVVDERNPLLKFWHHPLQLCVNVPRLGYVTGEHISVHIQLENPDQLKLHELAYQLNIVGTYIAARDKKKPKTKVLRTCLTRSVHGFCGLNDAHVQHLGTLHVPETSPSTIPGDCRCLQVAYEVEVVLTTMQQKRSLNALVPITIGTVSLRYDVAQLRGVPDCFGTNGESVPASVAGGSIAVAEKRSASLVTRSMDDLSREESPTVANAYAAATAPNSEMEQLNSGNSNLSNAIFMPSAALSKNVEHSRSCENLNFTPLYPFYELTEAASATRQLQPVTNESVPLRAAPSLPTTETTTTTAGALTKVQMIHELEALQRAQGNGASGSTPTSPTDLSSADTTLTVTEAATATSAVGAASVAPPSYEETQQQQQLMREMEALVQRRKNGNKYT